MTGFAEELPRADELMAALNWNATFGAIGGNVPDQLDLQLNRVGRLFTLTDANMQSTVDQPFTKNGTFATYVVTKVIARWKSGGTTVACAGGIYTGANKTGNAIVALTQSWLALSVAGKIVDATLAAIVSTDEQTANVFLSLTTGSTAAATADFFIYGMAIN